MFFINIVDCLNEINCYTHGNISNSNGNFSKSIGNKCWPDVDVLLTSKDDCQALLSQIHSFQKKVLKWLWKNGPLDAHKKSKNKIIDTDQSENQQKHSSAIKFSIRNQFACWFFITRLTKILKNKPHDLLDSFFCRNVN